MGEKPRKRIDIVTTKLVRESSLLYSKRVLSPESAADLFKIVVGDSDREFFLTLYLNAKNEPNSISIVSIGSASASIVHPREVLKGAVISNAAGIVFLHNHPSGDPEPSGEDIETTRRLIEAGNILGIKVIDHVIVGNGRWVSFKERGLI